MQSVTAHWLRTQGDRCALQAGRHVGSGEVLINRELQEKAATLARDWFAAAAQAYHAANELQGVAK